MNDAEIPLSCMVDERWQPLLEAAAAKKSSNALNLLGILLLENEETGKAEGAFRKALDIKESAFTLRNLAQVCIRKDDIPAAIAYMSRCCAISVMREYAEETSRCWYLRACTMRPGPIMIRFPMC